MGLYAAWKGSTDESIWWSSSETEGSIWEPQWQVYGVGTSHGPALVVFEGRLYMFWKGMGDDHRIWWTVTTTGNKWAPQQPAPSPGDSVMAFGTSESPAAVVADRGIHLFWKGVDDLGIWHSAASSHEVDGYVSLHWESQQRLGQVEPGEGGSLDLTRNAPAALATSTRVYLAGQNSEDDGIFVLSRPRDGGWDVNQIVNLGYVGTSNGPAMINSGGTTFIGSPDTLLLYWKGSGDDQAIWHAMSSDGGATWSDQNAVPNVGTSHRPALAIAGDRVYALWKGAGDDDNLYTAYCDPAKAESGLWRSPRTRLPVQPGEHHIPGVGTSHRPALAVFSP